MEAMEIERAQMKMIELEKKEKIAQDRLKREERLKKLLKDREIERKKHAEITSPKVKEILKAKPLYKIKEQEFITKDTKDYLEFKDQLKAKKHFANS